MVKYIKEIVILLLQIFIFYIFPIFCGPTDIMGMVFIMLISTFILSLLFTVLSKLKIKYIYGIVTAIIFIPSIFIYYNESALIHSMWYLIVSYTGIIVGVIINHLLKRLKHN